VSVQQATRSAPHDVLADVENQDFCLYAFLEGGGDATSRAWWIKQSSGRAHFDEIASSLRS
jgi:hypothetical protein